MLIGSCSLPALAKAFNTGFTVRGLGFRVCISREQEPEQLELKNLCNHTEERLNHYTYLHCTTRLRNVLRMEIRKTFGRVARVS